MREVTIKLSDAEGGAFDMKIDYHGEQDLGSPSHATAEAFFKWLEQHAAPKGPAMHLKADGSIFYDGAEEGAQTPTTKPALEQV